MLLGVALSLLAAATFGLNNAAVRRGVLTGSVAQGVAISVPLGVPIFLIAALPFGFAGALFSLSWQSMALLAAAGFVHFVWGRYCNYRAIQAMGANLVGPVQQTSLLITLALGVTILHESLTPLRIVGIALVVLSPAVMLQGRKHDEKRAVEAKAKGSNTPMFEPRYTEGYVYALLSSTGYGSSGILIRAALEDDSLTASLAGGFISYLGATIVLAFFICTPKQITHILSTQRRAALWFAISGFFVCLSQMFRYMALTVAPVTVVTPIQQTTFVFRLAFGKFLNPEYEVINAWVVWGIILAVVGALALSISTDLVLDYVPLPQAIVDIAHWHWP